MYKGIWKYVAFCIYGFTYFFDTLKHFLKYHVYIRVPPVGLCIWVQGLWKPGEGVCSFGAGITGDCEPAYLGFGGWTESLFMSNVCAPNTWACLQPLVSSAMR